MVNIGDLSNSESTAIIYYILLFKVSDTTFGQTLPVEDTNMSHFTLVLEPRKVRFFAFVSLVFFSIVFFSVAEFIFSMLTKLLYDFLLYDIR